MANWSLPTITDLYTNFLAYLKSRDDDAARMNDSRVAAATNPPDYTKRWNDTTKTIQNWLSSAWTSLIISIAGGGTGAATSAGARTNLDVYSKAEADARYTTTLSTSSVNLAADVTMTTAVTWYDGPSFSLAAGTWLVMGGVTIYGVTSGNMQAFAVLYAGGNVTAAEAVVDPGIATVATIPFSVFGIIILGSTTTVKIRCLSSVAGSIIRSIPPGVSAPASYLRAVKIA